MSKSRIVDKRRKKGQVATPILSIRKHCLECVGYSAQEVLACQSPACWLFPYRLGKRPKKGSV